MSISHEKPCHYEKRISFGVDGAIQIGHFACFDGGAWAEPRSASAYHRACRKGARHLVVIQVEQGAYVRFMAGVNVVGETGIPRWEG